MIVRRRMLRVLPPAAQPRVVSLRRHVITIFAIIQLVAPVGGAIIGYRIGHASAGTVGGVAGVAVGVAVGWAVGRLPFIVASGSLQRSLKRAPSSDLRARLDREYFILHLII